MSGPLGVIPGEMASVKEEVRPCLFSIQLKIFVPNSPPFSTPPPFLFLQLERLNVYEQTDDAVQIFSLDTPKSQPEVHAILLPKPLRKISQTLTSEGMQREAGFPTCIAVSHSPCIKYTVIDLTCYRCPNCILP